MKQRIIIPKFTYSGAESVSCIKEILSRERAANILLITDPGVLKSGIVEPVHEILNHAGVLWKMIDDVLPEPSYQAVEQMISKIKDFSCDLIIAIGGGSVMDSAKLYSVLKDTKYSILDLIKGKEEAKKAVKTVMIPTTCGTGAEATCNAIVAIPEKGVKMGIVSQEMIPDYVILDADMIAKLPSQIVAATGVDALAHAIECYTSNKATVLSNLYAAESAKLILHNIKQAYDNMGAAKAKESMLLGAYYGGIAITGSGTTAVHALSYPLGGKYHIPHGVSNAILFAPVMRINKESCAEQLAMLHDYVWPDEIGKSMVAKAESVIWAIEDIVAYTKIPSDLTAYGVGKEDLELLALAGSGQKRLLDNNRKELSLSDIRGIYQTVL